MQQLFDKLCWRWCLYLPWAEQRTRLVSKTSKSQNRLQLSWHRIFQLCITNTVKDCSSNAWVGICIHSGIKGMFNQDANSVTKQRKIIPCLFWSLLMDLKIREEHSISKAVCESSLHNNMCRWRLGWQATLSFALSLDLIFSYDNKTVISPSPKELAEKVDKSNRSGKVRGNSDIQRHTFTSSSGIFTQGPKGFEWRYDTLIITTLYLLERYPTRSSYILPESWIRSQSHSSVSIHSWWSNLTTFLCDDTRHFDPATAFSLLMRAWYIVRSVEHNKSMQPEGDPFKILLKGRNCMSIVLTEP